MRDLCRTLRKKRRFCLYALSAPNNDDIIWKWWKWWPFHHVRAQLLQTQKKHISWKYCALRDFASNPVWYVKFILGSILYAPEYAPTASFGGRIGSIQVFEWWHFNIICLILFDAYTLYTEYIIITYIYRSHIYNIRIPIFMALTILVKVWVAESGTAFLSHFPRHPVWRQYLANLST